MGWPPSEDRQVEGAQMEGASVAAQRPAEPSESGSDRFRYIQQRLRQLGAQYMVLETLLEDGNPYRFYCRMAVGDSRTYSRPFEATTEDPLEAMERVLAEVEAWRIASELSPPDQRLRR